jgi:hypothetical protein
MRRLLRGVLLLSVGMVGALVGWYAGTLVGLGLILFLVFADGGSPLPSHPTLLLAAALGALGGATLALWLARLAFRASEVGHRRSVGIHAT